MAKRMKTECVSITFSKVQSWLYTGIHSQVVLDNMFQVQTISPSVGNIHMKQQPNPQVVHIELINPLKDRGQNILEGATKAHVYDEE
jgi:hypothetical protein